jgi:hypothetical protein
MKNEMKEWAEVVAILAAFVASCVMAFYLLADLVAQFGESIPAPPW